MSASISVTCEYAVYNKLSDDQYDDITSIVILTYTCTRNLFFKTFIFQNCLDYYMSILSSGNVLDIHSWTCCCSIKRRWVHKNSLRTWLSYFCHTFYTCINDDMSNFKKSITNISILFTINILNRWCRYTSNRSIKPNTNKRGYTKNSSISPQQTIWYRCYITHARSSW